MTAEAFTDFLKVVFGQLVAHSEDGSVHDLCMDWRHIGEMLAAGNASYTELLNEAREEALERMVRQAEAVGANAVLNVRFSTSAITQGAAELLAYGTAVVLE